MTDVDYYNDDAMMDDEDFSITEDVIDSDDDFSPSMVKTTVLSNATNKDPSATKSKKKKKAIEDTYQKLTPHEHILKRPDTYIGSVEPHEYDWYVLNSTEISKKKIKITPGMYKIFDEIVVNAADNKQRDPDGMDKLDITINAEENKIVVRNNGKGIPIVKHKVQNVYVPTLIFGHLLTGSNFDDDEKKTTGGRNGYGAKLANIFSTRFEVDCVDVENGLKFHQVFTDNMKTVHEPTIKKLTKAELKKKDFVQVTFCPDLGRFSMTSMDEDTVALLSKRAYDLAGTLASSGGKKLTVTLNSTKLPIKSFKDYLGCFGGGVKVPGAYEKVNERWEVGVGPSTEDGSALQHISFVNGICTSSGGEHVNYIANQVITHLVKVIKKKNKGTEVSKTHIRNHLFIFVNCLIENPAFSSQTKEQLTTRSKDFGSTCKVSDKFLKQVEKCGVVDEILSFAKFRQNKAMKRHGGVKKSKLTGIPKLDDANHAGTAKSKDCTLIITEGDSAKSLAMSGLSVVGRDRYGVFPLKGKPLNVREANQAAVVKNEEIKNLVDIMGLKFGTTYTEENIKTLRYGHLMIMADQDHDGSHIKGLVINFLHYYWPGLLDIPGFLQQFITPIVKATKKRGESLTFFTVPEYLNWKEANQGGKGYKIKYYKGLGTSTSQEAKEYFSNLDLHEVNFGQISHDVKEEPERDDDSDMDFQASNEVAKSKIASGSDLIDMCFSKSRVDDRKSWLNALEKDTFLDYSSAQRSAVNYSDFVNKELILFSQADNQRSIPHVMDGFKPSQRKVLFSCFKRKLKGEIKVAQLAGYVSEHSAYHHGEASLTGTIINMAQNFVGSNNVNLLTPSGQFGTRRMGGKDSASPRYVFTKLETIARKIYHPDDDALLTYLNDDGLSIEPEYYIPVIPMALVNGNDGIGTGWSSSIPNYCPRQIIAALRRMVNGEITRDDDNAPESLMPHYNGFVGDIVAESASKFKVHGKAERKDDTTLFISELPIKKWTQDYKLFLETMMNGNPAKKQEPEIKDFSENHTDTTVAFTVTTSTKEQMDAFENFKGGIMAKFKLTSNLSTSNMNLFDTEGRITKYERPEDIMEQFFGIRFEFYAKRKALLLENLRHEQKMLKNKARFVEEVCDGDLIVSNRKRKDILNDLRERGYDLISKDEENKEETSGDNDDGNSASDTNDEGENDEIESTSKLAKGYEYLLGMKIWSLTYEKAEELRRQVEEKNQEVQILSDTSPAQIWSNDLDDIEIALDERDEELRKQQEEEVAAMNGSKTKKKKAAPRKKKNVNDDDDDFVPTKPKSRKPAAKRTHSTKKNMESEEELAKRLESKLLVSPPAKKAKSRVPPSDDQENESILANLEVQPSSSRGSVESEDSFLSTVNKTKKAAPKKKATAKKTKTTKKVTKKAPKKKEIDEDEFLDDESSDEEIVIAPRARRGRAAASKKVYTLDDSILDDETESDSDF